MLTCVNDRRNISPLVFECYRRLKLDFDIQLVVGYTSPEDGRMVEAWSAVDLGVHPVGPIENVPGKKWNTVLKYAFQSSSNFDYFMTIGDDDSISTNIVSAMIKRGADYMGTNLNGYIDSSTNKAMVHTYPMDNKLIGAGRMISRKAIEQTCYKMRLQVTTGFRAGMDKFESKEEIMVPIDIGQYLLDYKQAKQIGSVQFVGLFPDGAMRSLDHLSELNLVMSGFVPIGVNPEGVHVVDVKTDVNIWSYSILERKCKEVKIDKCTWFMNDREKQILAKLHS